MASSYTASDIEVLSGLDPVRRRPGMYTDTTRPNHLAHEVIEAPLFRQMAAGGTLSPEFTRHVVDDLVIPVLTGYQKGRIPEGNAS